MEIVNIKTDKLIPYVNNPRNNQNSIDKVASSIKEFGFKVPLVIDKDNVVVTGHTRLKAAKKLGIEEVPCVVADDLSDAQIKAFRIADNKVSEYAQWDEDLLKIELEQLEEMDFDLDNLNIDYSDFDLDIGDDIEEIEPEEVEVPEVPEEPKTKLGDIYQLGNHRLMCGDSTSKDDVNKLLDGVKVDMVLTDPPYGINVVQGSKIGGDKSFGKVGGGKIVQSNTYMSIKGDDTTDTAEKSYQIMKDVSKNQIIFGGNYFTNFLQPKACWIVWDKENTGNFADVELAWTSFDKGAKLYRWLWNGLCRKGDRKTEGVKRVHPTQKPVGLIGEILKDFNEQNTILDLFGGSGSTLMACEQLNRQCYMMEYEPHYVDVIIKRWEDYTGNKAIKLE